MDSLLPSNILLLTTFLLISYFPIYGYARVQASHTIADKSFRSDCAFNLDDYTFNLCPLAGTATATATAKSSRDHQLVEGSSSGTRVYEVALGGMSTGGSRLPTACDSDTWVCMTDRVFIETHGSGSEDEHGFLSKNKSRRNLEAQVIPVARRNRADSHHGKILASMVIRDAKSYRFSPMLLSLDGGEAEGRPQSAEIEMVCDFDVDSYLEFIDERNGIHSFRWTTRHGCPTHIESIYMPSSRLSTTEDGADNESEQSKGDDELLPPRMSTARRWIIVFIIIGVISLLCSSLFLASPRARHIAGETIKSRSRSLMPILPTATINFRSFGRSILALTFQSFLHGVGKPFKRDSNQIVRWAEEDMQADDTMVNCHRRYDEENWNEVDVSEYIPLTANPKRGRDKDVKSYGATPDVESFEQRGWHW